MTKYLLLFTTKSSKLALINDFDTPEQAYSAMNEYYNLKLNAIGNNCIKKVNTLNEAQICTFDGINYHWHIKAVNI